MGIRTTLKNIIKKALGRESAPAPKPYTPPPASVQEPVVAPTQPEPIETVEPSETKKHKIQEEPKEEAPVPPQEVEETQASAKEEPSLAEESVEQPAIAETTEETSVATEQPEEPKAAPKEVVINTEGAFAVFEIKRLFGDSCPSCGASTSNNWAYSDNNFVCQSCEATL